MMKLPRHREQARSAKEFVDEEALHNATTPMYLGLREDIALLKKSRGVDELSMYATSDSSDEEEPRKALKRPISAASSPSAKKMRPATEEEIADLAEWLAEETGEVGGELAAADLRTKGPMAAPSFKIPPSLASRMPREKPPFEGDETEEAKFISSVKMPKEGASKEDANNSLRA